MKIRKYQGANEKEAMLKIKEELGREALIVSVKNIKPKGLYRLFKKPYVEVTAALDDRSIVNETSRKEEFKKEELIKETAKRDLKNDEEYLDRFQQLIQNISKTIHAKEQEENSNLLDEAGVLPNSTKTMDTKDKEVKEQTIAGEMETPILKVIYEQLLDNEVSEIIINELLEGLGLYIQNQEHQDVELNEVVSIVYNRMVKLLSDAQPIDISGAPGKPVFFVGPTGVGKTTTIAKIASYYTLTLGKKIALVTADTYRIAAVEQLRTYANILGIPIKVVYSADELEEAVRFFADKDLILIDTAGRSHKNEVQQQELDALLKRVDYKEVYLVLSMGTKYKDLVQITKAYENFVDYKIVFTKLDETECFGNLLNIKIETQAKLSYVTFGQNVPDDMSEVNPHDIAKKILGGNV